MADKFQATAVNQKNVSLNANQALSAKAIIEQKVDEQQIASSERKEEIER